VTGQLDDGKKCLAVFLDLAKAFDTVSHILLLEKLLRMGIRGKEYGWFKSYISNREYSVKMGNEISGIVTTQYGVPQGSVLGPTLFLIYINDLCKMDKTDKIIAYADDTVLVFTADEWTETFIRANGGLNAVGQWMRENLLTVNVDKTKYTTFSITAALQPEKELELTLHGCATVTNECKCKNLERVDSYKYLGLFIDRHLRWNDHVTCTVKRLRKMFYIFRILRNILDIAVFRTIYYAMVQGILEYGIIGWGGMAKSQLLPLERTQKTIIKIMYKWPKRYSTDALYRDSYLLDIRQMYMRTILTYIHRNTHEYEPDYVFLQSTRNRTNLRVPKMRTAFAQRFYNFLAPRLYNKILPEINEKIVYDDERRMEPRFKRHVTQWLMKKGRVESTNILLQVLK
jgi:hypothetical protein